MEDHITPGFNAPDAHAGFRNRYRARPERAEWELLMGKTPEGRTRSRQLSCGQLDRLALLLFSIEHFDLEPWEPLL